MNKIKPEDVTVEELKDGLRDISNYALIQILTERIKDGEVHINDVSNLVGIHPECIGLKVWQRNDIRVYAQDHGFSLTEEQIKDVIDVLDDVLCDCSDDWSCIGKAIDEVFE